MTNKLKYPLQQSLQTILESTVNVENLTIGEAHFILFSIHDKLLITEQAVGTNGNLMHKLSFNFFY
jgi:hypothetical protein